MKALRSALYDQEPKSPYAFYLFLIDKPNDKNNTEGYSPIRKRQGFIFTKGQIL